MVHALYNINRAAAPRANALVDCSPNKILTPNPRSLHRRSNQRTARQPNPPGGAHDAETQPEGDAEVGVAVGGHVGQDFGPAGVTVGGLAGV